ncbi:putative ubiquitin-conjugating enzyme E2 25-like, partial [Trifolium medium]|nr:putative ubiquitin-conjugating enzyme E2 25-like [Trifolium medium]
AILRDAIDIDYDDDSVDLVIVGEIVSKSNKGNLEASKLLHGSNPPFASNFRSVKKAGGSSNSYHANFKDEILRKLGSFKQFDNVSDTSHHFFVRKKFSLKEHPKNWSKRIQRVEDFGEQFASKNECWRPHNNSTGSSLHTRSTMKHGHLY